MKIRATQVSTVEYNIVRKNYPNGCTDEEILDIDVLNFKNPEHDLFNEMENVKQVVTLEIVYNKCNNFIEMLEK